jgi:anhydro-N-acetylmuramic acid kinase
MTAGAHPLVQLWARLERGEAIVAGVLSGTSADGIDVALLRFAALGPPSPLAFATLPFPPELRTAVRGALDGAELDARALALLSRDLGRAFGLAARSLAEEQALSLDLVGSHGQTVYHHDGNEPTGAATLQLGDGDFVARSARALTVSDFRQADIASGGEGAPLSAALDPVLFPHVARPAAILNLGGMANVTYLDGSMAPLAFDTGPANALLDGLARKLLGEPCDRDGAAALRGRPSSTLIAESLRHPYFDRRPPKSTGRDTFGQAFVERFLARARVLGLSAEDGLASATEFVAETVAQAFERHLPAPPRELVLCGGGALNPALRGALARRTGFPTVTSAHHGLAPEAREATFFAHLAVRSVLYRPSTEPSITGAARGGVLGKLSWPPADDAAERVPVSRSRGPDPG